MDAGDDAKLVIACYCLGEAHYSRAFRTETEARELLEEICRLPNLTAFTTETRITAADIDPAAPNGWLEAYERTRASVNPQTETP